MKIMSFDPSLTSFGIALFDFDIKTKNLDLIDLKLIETEPTKTKGVRKNSDDLRRCGEIVDAVREYAGKSDICFSEVPTGAQSSRAAFSFGMMLGILASLRAYDIPLVQVLPNETKMASVGSKTASKDAIIAWAFDKYPNSNWLTVNRKGEKQLTKKNEHLADAVAVAYAGVKTDQFKGIVSLLTLK